jgi:hypothetical protein
MIFPTIHLNGTSQNELLEGWLKINHALHETLDAMYREQPNGRDYYPQGPAAFLQAREEHEARILKIKDIQREIMQIVDYVADAEGGR